MGNFIDLTGKRYERISVLRKDKTYKSDTMWLCICDCGELKTVSGNSLRRGHTKSCGCLKKENAVSKTHGKSKEKLYKIWGSMKMRCLNSNDKFYKDYGGRGIAVCDEWKENFLAFYNWAMENGFEEGLSIDRMDNNKGYFPNNCKWATMKEQQNNRRNNYTVDFNGKKQTLSQWADELGTTYYTLKNRLHIGWSIEKTLTTPIRLKRKIK